MCVCSCIRRHACKHTHTHTNTHNIIHIVVTVINYELTGTEPSSAQQQSVKVHVCHPYGPPLIIYHTNTVDFHSSPSRLVNCTKEVDHDLQKIARALAGGCVDSVAKAVFAHSALRERILLKVLDLVNSECSALCRKTGADGPSPFRQLPLKNVEEFSWDIYIQELKLRSPFLLKLFRTLVQHNEHRNMTMQGPKHTPGICMSIAALLQECNREMAGIQTYVSLVLFNHAQKQVSLQRIQVMLPVQMHVFIMYTGVYTSQSPKYHSLV